MNRFIIFSTALLLGVPSMFGWGQKGHDTVAAIAERHLTPTTAAALDSILDGRSIVYWSNWLDNASHTPKYNYSQSWHYKNIDADQTFENAPKYAKGDIVTALNREIGILMNPKETASERELAVVMIVHLLGDLHQPMHLGHYSDLGGNKTEVKFFDTKTNLHSAWDSRLPEAAHKWSYTEWADQIDRINEEQRLAITDGNIADWGKETYEICTEVYNATPKGTVISYDYIADWTPTIEQQFLRGGIRLAEVLNSIFDPEYKRTSSISFTPYVRK